MRHPRLNENVNVAPSPRDIKFEQIAKYYPGDNVLKQFKYIWQKVCCFVTLLTLRTLLNGKQIDTRFQKALRDLFGQSPK